MKKTKFNLMDGFLIAVIVVALAAAAFLVLKPKTAKPAEPKTAIAQYDIELAKVQKFVADEFQKALENGEVLSIGEKERFDAEIVDVKVKPSSRHIINHNTQDIVIVEDPLFFDVTLTLTSEVTETASDIMADNIVLKVGNTVAAKSRLAAGYGYITDLELKNN